MSTPAPNMFDEVFQDLPAAPAPFSVDEVRARQARLTSGLSKDTLLLLPAPIESTRSNDVHYRYRSSSDLLYLTDWDQPESMGYAMHDGSSWVWGLFVQPKDTLKEIWEGRRLGVEGVLALGMVDRAHSIHDREDIVRNLLNDASRVLLRQHVDHELDELVRVAMTERSRPRQQFGTGPVVLEDPSARIAELRLRKSDEEVAMMRHAADISSRAHIAAMKLPSNGLNERHLQAVIEGGFVYGGGDGWAYPSIVGSGVNATVLHYKVNNDDCVKGDVVLIDAGTEYRGYASDITRSWPVGGSFSEAQREIYTVVLDAQKAAINACKVGEPYNAPHEAARRVLAEGLIALGVINQSLDEALDAETGQLRDWYMHNTGHWLGLDVHDVGIYRPNGEPRLLESGMVLTVEPGLYFGAWRPDVSCPPRYADIGIRIEDDVLVTDNGPVVLSEACPKELDALEKIVGA
ncbi:MAG TPA: M24 family metallopeptidase [Candidatus Poseidoniales archaeon]|nr:MAG TPA: M24 family metallopeptidase [Candidatus Poseidoniales archaeon]